MISAFTASSASPETPPKSLIPAAANAVCAPPPIPPQIKISTFSALRTPANAPCPLPFVSTTSDLHIDKTLQDNDKIETAIAALQQEPSQEMLAHVLTLIRRRMNEKGELIIAVDPSAAASGLQVQAVQTDDGRKWWAAFTSFDEEVKGSGSVMSTFLTGMKQLFTTAITAEGIEGVIINPWNRTIMLDKTLIRIILGENN